ncbi:MAG: hypothetical protein RIB60_06710 [Phycisphaerales bacterium]
MPSTSPIVSLAGLLAISLAAGCSGPVQTSQRGPAPRAYPFEPGQSQVHDIQVFRDGTRLRLTNTTAGSFGPGTLWVNRRFSHPVNGLGVGESLDLDLYDFVDEFGDAFRAGGFFAKQDPDPVVIVQYEAAADDVMHGFVLVRDDMN